MKKYWIAIFILLVIVVIESTVLIVIFQKRKKITPAIKAPKAAVLKGKIAIVLDDWGYNLNNIPIAKSIRQPFTAAILPNLPYSQEVARFLHQSNKEIILHLPMEPNEKYRLENNTLLTAMPGSKILEILNNDLDSVLFARGVSNHMGSKATSDGPTMETILKELKKRKLYFLDSYVTGNSVVIEKARLAGLPAVKRNIFLDNNSDPEYIRGQLYKLKMRARMYGNAVGIGHDRKNTLAVLKEMLPAMEKEGYKFVFVSEITG